MKSMATLDPIIYQFLEDKNYFVKSDGTIWSWLSQYGHPSTEPRELTSVKNKYKVVRYGKYRLYAHRIVWAKFKGKLKEDLNILHVDGNMTNNHPKNLDLVTVSETNFARFSIYDNPPVLGNYKPDLKARVVELRKKGFSVKEIQKKTGASRGSVSLWTQGIALTTKQKERLDEKVRENARTLADRREVHANQFGVIDDE